MPVVRVPESKDKDETLLASSKIDTFMNSEQKEEIKIDIKKLPVITPRTDFAIKQANHLVERICRDNGVEAPKFSFATSLNGQEDQISNMSTSKHTSVLRLAEYLHKRGQIERDYALGIQKLNRHVVQTGDTDERLGQLIVMGEKTAAGHMDWARKIGEERIIDDLKTLCSENDEQRRYLHAELKKLRGTWSKAVGAFEKVRKNRDKALKAADSAQLTLDTTLSRGNTNKATIDKLHEDVQKKSERARIARDEYNRAMSALTAHQNQIFKVQIPQCYEGFEKMERARIAAIRSSMINLAQVHLAVSNVEVESGQRWLKSLVSLGIDDEIEIFVRSVEERADTLRHPEELIVEDEEPEEEESIIEEQVVRAVKPVYSSSNNLTNSESDLLSAASRIDDSSDPTTLKERWDKLETLQSKLRQQLEALERMEEAYSQQHDEQEDGNESTLEAVRMSMRGIAGEIEDNAVLMDQIDEKLSRFGAIKQVKQHGALELNNPMSSILEELNRLDQRRATAHQQQQPVIQVSKKKPVAAKKKSLSRSFEDILDDTAVEEFIETASPKATGLKLPGTQWTPSSIHRSNAQVDEQSDYYCVEEDELVEERRMFRNRLGSAGSDIADVTTSADDRSASAVVRGETTKDSNVTGSQSPVRRKSASQSTPNTAANTTISTSTPITPPANMIPRNRKELFKVQALYNFIGRKETDELDLRTGEILGVYEGNGEWWEAENEAGIRGYIPFNYVIRI